MMRVTLDTNILARVAFSPHGPAGELFDVIQAHHTLVLSPAMLTELSRVLNYERVRRLHRLGDAAIAGFVKSIEAGALIVGLAQPVAAVVSADPDDDYVIATAVAGNSGVICTRNKHFVHPDVLDYCRSHGIRVLSDLELLGELRATTPG